MQVGYYNTGQYYTAPKTQPYAAQNPASAKPASSSQSGHGDAAIVTLSEAARSAVAIADFEQVLASARALLNTLLGEAERDSPLQDQRLALDMTRLDARELYAISVTDDGLFTTDERKAAELEMERRFHNALTGPLAVSKLTSDYRPLYRAAAEYFDGMGEEQKATPEWIETRAAIDTALARLAGDKGTLPKDIVNDPVAAWLPTQTETGEDTAKTPASLEENLRAILDKRYDDARQAGRLPTFDASNARGHYIDLGAFDAETISAMKHNRQGLFSAEEVRAANNEIRSRASVALSEAYKDAANSGDPTAFASNIVALYSSLSPEVRAAAGFSESMLNAAMASYKTTSSLLQMMASMQNPGGSGGLFGGR